MGRFKWYRKLRGGKWIRILPFFGNIIYRQVFTFKNESYVQLFYGHVRPINDLYYEEIE